MDRGVPESFRLAERRRRGRPGVPEKTAFSLAAGCPGENVLLAGGREGAASVRLVEWRTAGRGVPRRAARERSVSRLRQWFIPWVFCGGRNKKGSWYCYPPGPLRFCKILGGAGLADL